MARAIYAHELIDPDLEWLVTTFEERFPDFIPVRHTCLPLVYIKAEYNLEDLLGNYSKKGSSSEPDDPY
ncbi:MAG: hypothetical protein D6780_02400, partial [Candidatus Dadabacteria bacterium]